MVVKPLDDTASFIQTTSREETPEDQSKDSGYFTRNQLVLHDATYGEIEKPADEFRDIMNEKMMAQLGEQLPSDSSKAVNESHLSFAP
jgi:hypothetical protein